MSETVENPTIIVMNVSLDDRSTVQYRLRLLDDVEISVQRFASQHKLGKVIQNKLLKAVKENRESLMDELGIDDEADEIQINKKRPSDQEQNHKPKTDSINRNQTANFNQFPIEEDEEYDPDQDQFANQINEQIKEVQNILSEDATDGAHNASGYKKPARPFQNSENRISDNQYGHSTSRDRIGSGRIHDRLYKEGLTKHIKRERDIFSKQIIEQEKLENSLVGKQRVYSREIVDRLYYKGLTHEQVKEIQREKLKSLRENERNQECTYQPQVSRVSTLIAEKKSDRKAKPIEQVLMAEGLSRLRKLEQAHASKQTHEQSELQEKPQISQLSKEIAREKSRVEGKSGTQVHDALYEDSIQRKNKSIVFEQHMVQELQNSFRPEINSESERIVYSKHGNSSMLERLSKYAHEKEKKILLRRAEAYPPLEEMINPDTNMPFFHPLTGRSPTVRNSGEDIGRYLHNLSSAQKAKLDQKRETLYDRKQMVVHATGRSTSIIEKKKAQAFKAIFEALDSDKDGLVSADRIDIEALDEGVLKIISPLLINMEELSMQIDELTFRYGMEEIFKKLSVPDKDRLLLKKRKSFSDHDCTFAPMLNKKSLQIASGKKSIIDTVNRVAMKNKLKAHAKNLEDSSQEGGLGRIREENCESRSGIRKDEEDENMTFQPSLTKYNVVHSHYIKPASDY